MTAGLKHQLEYALSASKRNAQALTTMLEVYAKLEPEGWTPAIYDQCVRELYRVQMCVVHRSLVNDMLRLADQINADNLPDRYEHADEDGTPEFSRQDFQRIKDALQTALSGLPPK